MSKKGILCQCLSKLKEARNNKKKARTEYFLGMALIFISFQIIFKLIGKRCPLHEWKNIEPFFIFPEARQ